MNLLKVDATEPLANTDLDRLFGGNLDTIDRSVHALYDTIIAVANAGHTPVAPVTLSGNALMYRIENASTLFDIPAELAKLPSGTPVRVTGFTITLNSVSALTAFYDLLDTLKGLDANMQGLTKAQMHGTIRLVAPASSGSSGTGGLGGTGTGGLGGGSVARRTTGGVAGTLSLNYRHPATDRKPCLLL